MLPPNTINKLLKNDKVNRTSPHTSHSSAESDQSEQSTCVAPHTHTIMRVINKPARPSLINSAAERSSVASHADPLDSESATASAATSV